MPDGLLDHVPRGRPQPPARHDVQPIAQPRDPRQWAVDVGDLRSDRLRRLHEYWQARRPDGAKFPARRELDPTSFGFALGMVGLVEVEAPMPPRFRYRLAGYVSERHFGTELAGRTLDAIPDHDQRRRLEWLFTGTVILAMPLASRVHANLRGETWRCESICLPLSTHWPSIDMLLVGETFDRAD
jgi:hypothetical protein